MALVGILVGFAGFVASLFALVWRGFDSEGNRQPSFRRWLYAAVFFFALFIFSLPRLPAPLLQPLSR
ncbi:MAG TPA: hypothetical protein VF681_12045 [Abditibacteriaceae bacterium]|jgi:hypothetical protein